MFQKGAFDEHGLDKLPYSSGCPRSCSCVVVDVLGRDGTAARGRDHASSSQAICAIGVGADTAALCAARHAVLAVPRAGAAAVLVVDSRRLAAQADYFYIIFPVVYVHYICLEIS